MSGFFSLKAVCGVCENEVGLNRFKIKKSNSWLCASCLKKAGIMSVDVGKDTVEVIKEKIAAKNAKKIEDSAFTEAIAPMISAQGMYQYCLDNNFGQGFNEKWGLKHFGVLEENLINGEEPLMTFIGLHNYKSSTKHESNFAYAVTNKRIIFGQKTITGQKFKAVYHERINDISFEKGMIYGIITIDTPQEKFNVAIDRGAASAINSHIHGVLEGIKESNNTQHPQSVSSVSAADELKKFKELLDLGVINEEEFSAKKKQLLNI